MKSTKNLLDFWEEQMKQSHRSSNYFFRKSPSHYHMMLLIMSYHKQNLPITVEELKSSSLAGPFDFTEGPVWTGEVVLFTDIPNNRIMRYNPSNGETDLFLSLIHI